MKKVITILALLLHYGYATAMPAYPKRIPVVVDGKDVYIRLFGDEYNKRAESEDGYTIIQNDQNQWCFASLNSDLSITPSQWRLGVDYSGIKEFKKFIDSTPKHIISTQNSNSKTDNYKGIKQLQIVEGKRKVLIIMMEYKDLNCVKGQEDFYRLFNEEGYHDDQAKGSVRDYYLSVSYNKLELECDVIGPYTSTYDMSYYGKNRSGKKGEDSNSYALFVEAITNASRDVDLNQYDGDKDGFIDNVHIIFAGYGEEAGANSNAIWSHEATFNRPYEIQGMKIDRYSCAPELRGNSGNGISRIGPHCHEIGHALGAMDYYDTDYATGGGYEGTGMWDVMASGSWNNDGITPADFNPYVKAYNFGWITPKPLPSGLVVLTPSCNDNTSYYILKSSEYGDYYLLENRSKDKWGEGIPGEGLLFYHVHPNIVNAGNEINASAPQLCYVVCASTKSKKPTNNPKSYGDINSTGCPYPGSTNNHEFGQTSTPEAFYWSESSGKIEISNITLHEDGTITLTNNSTNSDYVPSDMVSLFFEGFEGALQVSLEKGDNTWQIIENPENTQSIVDRPLAYEGIKSLQLSARNSNQDVTSSLEFDVHPIYDSKIRVKLYATSVSLGYNKVNSVRVGFRLSDDDKWQYQTVEITKNSKWLQFLIDLPPQTLTHLRIEGTAMSKSVLAIDNIEVEQVVPNEETNIKKVNVHEDSDYIYTIEGRRLNVMRYGLNIVKMPDGSYKKVFVK